MHSFHLTVSVAEHPTNDRTLHDFDPTVDLSDHFASISIVDDVYISSSAKQTVLNLCGQTEPIPFADNYREADLPQCRKIGEGISGEVFMYRPSPKQSVVLKVIPIEGKTPVNGEPQKTFAEILQEIVISTELSNLRDGREFATPGFARLMRVRCVRGVYPEHLIDDWELYYDNFHSDNDDPSQFKDDQLYVVLEQEYAGLDLEAFRFQNAVAALSALRQIALSLAVAEKKLQFEHRDLHWGNILLAPTDQKQITFKLDGEEINVESHGVKVTIIDYTLSRMNVDNKIYFYDLANEIELFDAKGDYQFYIYGQMRDRLRNNWNAFNAQTNVLWLDYVVNKFIDGARYLATPRCRLHANALTQLLNIRDDLLDHSSACSVARMIALKPRPLCAV